MPSIILVGGGGHCKSCVEVLSSIGDWEIAGIVDSPERVGEKVLGYEILGCDSDLPRLARRYGAARVTVGQIESKDVRRRLFEAARAAGFRMPAIFASTALVSARSSVGEGTIVMHRAFVNAEASVGVNCIVNSGAIIEHEARIGAHCHVSTGAIVNGSCSIGEGSFVGSGAVVKNGVSIAPGCVVGAGAVVTRDLAESGVYAGSPARRIR